MSASEKKTPERRRRASRLTVALARRGVPEAALGAVLSIDPASGASSLPGYAIFYRGRWVESGVIDVVGSAAPLHERLAELARTLREELVPNATAGVVAAAKEYGDTLTDTWDLVVIEDVPAKNYKLKAGKGGAVVRTGSITAQVTLHRSVGAVLSAVKARHVVYVHPATWHAHVGPDYKKSDEGDAVAMAEVVVSRSLELIEQRKTPAYKRKAFARSKAKGGAA